MDEPYLAIVIFMGTIVRIVVSIIETAIRVASLRKQRREALSKLRRKSKRMKQKSGRKVKLPRKR
jgi:hypothetical protein